MLPLENDKNGAIWCILIVPKYVTINLKINIFWTINQQPKFCAIIFSKINPDAHVSTIIKTFTFYKTKAPRSERNVKNGGFFFLTSNITNQARRQGIFCPSLGGRISVPFPIENSHRFPNTMSDFLNKEKYFLRPLLLLKWYMLDIIQ